MGILFAALILKIEWGDVPTWLLVVVGGAAAWIALRTLNDIREQTRNTAVAAGAAQKSADAALLNARAVINAERAWVLVELEPVPGFSVMKLGEGAEGNPYNTASFRLKYVNEGKTIAWINEILACFQVVKELPEKPDFAALEILNREPKWVKSKGSRYLDETLETKGQVAVGDMSIIWGVIRYRDAFGEHETIFGFRIPLDGQFKRLRNPAYNQIT